jgi:hypothetical protein
MSACSECWPSRANRSIRDSDGLRGCRGAFRAGVVGAVMEQPLEFLKSKIPNFPGYATDDDRMVSDELVRSYLGERLAEMEAHPGISDEARKSVGELLLRADAATVQLADGASDVTPDDVAQFVQQSARALDGRDLAMRGEVAA